MDTTATTFASINEAATVVDATWATTPAYVVAQHVAVRLTESTVATYALSRNGSVRRVS